MERKRKRNRVKAIALAAFMMLTVVFTAVPAFAAVDFKQSDFKISPVTSDSKDYRVFTVVNKTGTNAYVSYGTQAQFTNNSYQTVQVNANNVNAPETIRIYTDISATDTYFFFASDTVPSSDAYGNSVYQSKGTREYTIPVHFYKENTTQTVLASDTLTLQPNKSTTYTAQGSVNDYTLISSNPQAAVHGGTANELVFFYRYTPPQKFDCTVLFKNTNEVQIGQAAFEVPVNGTGTYSVLPTVTGTDGKNYELATGQPKTLQQQYAKGQRVFTVYYKLIQQSHSKQYTIKVVYMNNATQTEISSKRVTVPAGNNTVTENMPKTVADRDGNQYNLMAGQPTSISHKSDNATRVYNVMYESAGLPTSDYKVNIELRDIEDNTLLERQTLDVKFNQTARSEEFKSERTFNGQTYLLANANSEIVHPFDKGLKTYTVYYYKKGANLADYEFTAQAVNVTDMAVLESKTGVAKVEAGGGTVSLNQTYANPSGGTALVLSPGESNVVKQNYFRKNNTVNRVYYYDPSLMTPEEAQAAAEANEQQVNPNAVGTTTTTTTTGGGPGGTGTDATTGGPGEDGTDIPDDQEPAVGADPNAPSGLDEEFFTDDMEDKDAPTTNFLKKAVQNQPWLIGILAAVIIGGIVVFILYKRREKEEETF